MNSKIAWPAAVLLHRESPEKWPLKWRTVQTSKRRKKYEKLTWERSMTHERQAKAEAYPYLAAVRRRARRKPSEKRGEIKEGERRGAGLGLFAREGQPHRRRLAPPPSAVFGDGV